MGEPLRIVIADDNYLVREGTRRLLEDSGQVTVLAAVGSAAELLDAVRRSRPGAVLTDIRMPPAGGAGSGADDAVRPAMEGIDAAHAIRAADPDIGVVVLSQYADESYAFELFKNGTAGLAYLLKDRVGDLQQLLAALREVTNGGSVIDPQVVDALVSRRARLRESPLARLTPRELDVLREMAQGRGNAGIAAELSLSESSVEKYVNAIFAKLDLASEQLVHRRVAAVLTFLRDAGLRSAKSGTVPEALPLSCRSPRRAYPRRAGTGR
jgi:DNA-binding NarL/FixJ family response regulator